ERQRDPSGAAAELEDAAVHALRNASPEGDVAAAERARVLPVVERRVVVPALPTVFFQFVVGPHPHDLCLRGLRRSALLLTTFRLVNAQGPSPHLCISAAYAARLCSSRLPASSTLRAHPATCVSA